MKYPNTPSLSLDEMTKGVEAAIKACIKFPNDIKAVSGELN